MDHVAKGTMCSKLHRYPITPSQTRPSPPWTQTRGSERCAMVQNYSVHLNVAIKDHDRASLALPFSITSDLLPVIVNIRTSLNQVDCPTKLPLMGLIKRSQPNHLKWLPNPATGNLLRRVTPRNHSFAARSALLRSWLPLACRLACRRFAGSDPHQLQMAQRRASSGARLLCFARGTIKRQEPKAATRGRSHASCSNRLNKIALVGFPFQDCRCFETNLGIGTKSCARSLFSLDGSRTSFTGQRRASY